MVPNQLLLFSFLWYDNYDEVALRLINGIIFYHTKLLPQLHRLLCQGQNPKMISAFHGSIESYHENFTYAKPKVHISCAVTAKLISTFVFATRTVLFLFLNVKIQAFSIVK